MIGYGAMLMEGLVGVVALIAAAALPNAMYYDINIDLAKPSRSSPSSPQGARRRPRRRALPGRHGELVEMEKDVRSRSTAGPAAP